MGCSSSISVTNSAHDDLPSPNLVLAVILSEQQRTAVLRSWRYLSTDLSNRGIKIFRRIFQQNPHVKALFMLQDVEDDELKRDRRFKGHAVRFMQAIGAVVEHIDNYRQTLGPLLNSLGEQHTRFEGFRPAYFNCFQDAIVAVFAEELGTEFSPLVKEAWTILLDFIRTELTRGYMRSRSTKARDVETKISDAKQKQTTI